MTILEKLNLSDKTRAATLASPEAKLRGKMLVALARFGQVDGALNRQYQGAGLGLLLTKSLIELHGGSLALKSEVNVGTTATIRFPAERTEPFEKAASLAS